MDDTMESYSPLCLIHLACLNVDTVPGTILYTHVIFLATRTNGTIKTRACDCLD
jgi:hypothetical protein